MAEAKTKAELLKTARTQVPEVTPAELGEGAAGTPAGPHRRAREGRDGPGHRAGRQAGAARLPGAADRGDPSRPRRRGGALLRRWDAQPARGQDAAGNGYRKVRSLRAGTGVEGRRTAVEVPFRLTDAQRNRYSRTCSSPRWARRAGEAAQGQGAAHRRRRLGSPAGSTWPRRASAGWHRGRRPCHESNSSGRSSTTTERIGMRRPSRARDDPQAEPRRHRRRAPVRLTRENALELFRRYDVIIDGSTTSAPLPGNDPACSWASPYVHGRSSASTASHHLHPRGGRPCYRCLFPSRPRRSWRRRARKPRAPCPSGVDRVIQGSRRREADPRPGRAAGRTAAPLDALEQRFREVKYERDANAPLPATTPCASCCPSTRKRAAPSLRAGGLPEDQPYDFSCFSCSSLHGCTWWSPGGPRDA